MGSMMIILGLVRPDWYILGKPMDNGSPGVILACNAIPLASVLAEFTLDGKPVKNTALPTKDEWCCEAARQG